MIEIGQEFEWITQHGGPEVRWDGRYAVAGDGLEGWSSTGFGSEPRPLELGKHLEETNGRTRMLTLGLTSAAAGPVHWSSTLEIGTGRYARSGGYAPDFPAALLLAETYVHESQKMGTLTWWRESETRWVSWVGPFSLQATKIVPYGQDSDPYWRFEVNGKAPTLEEAALLAEMGGRGER